MIPIGALSGAFDAAGFWQNLATIFGTVAVYAQRRAAPERDAVEELTFRLRHPVRAAVSSPLVTIRRKLDRRRAS